MNVLNYNEYNNISIFSDIHFGKSRDSQVKLTIVKKFISWFIAKNREQNTQVVVFNGDWFDNRNAISIITLNIAYDCIKELSKYWPVILIVGNHDTTYKGNIDVNSIRIFQEIHNVTVIQDITELKLKDREVLLCPWQPDINTLTKRYDYACGHFEFAGASLAQNQVFDGTSTILADLSRLAPVVFSGHFHIHKEYPYKDSTIISIGSPVELDWGDIGNDKGYYFLDTQTRQHTFIKNDGSPIHHYYYWSKLKDGTQKLSKTEIEGNYIKLVVDNKYSFEVIMTLAAKINTCNPIKPCEIDFVYNVTTDLLDSMKTINMDAEIKMTPLEYIHKFITKLPAENVVGIDMDEVLALADSYYDRSEYKSNET